MSWELRSVINASKKKLFGKNVLTLILSDLQGTGMFVSEGFLNVCFKNTYDKVGEHIIVPSSAIKTTLCLFNHCMFSNSSIIF